MTDSEKLWLARSREGDVPSFEKLIERYQKTAYNISLRMMQNPEDAKDATQEALIKAFRSIQGFRGDSGFSTWLYRIVMNTCKDELRRKQRTRTISLDQGAEGEPGYRPIELADETLSPETLMEQKNIRSQIQSAIRELPEANRSALILRDIQGFSYEDISELLNCPVGTVKSRINRGRQIMRQQLTGTLATEGGRV